MTAIKEYPFDLSDLQNQPVAGEDKPPTLQQIAVSTRKKSKLSVGSQEGKRKVSIMADESSKDRENLPSERERYVTFLTTSRLTLMNLYLCLYYLS